MRLTSAQYAKSLYEVTLDKSPDEIAVLVSGFVKVLAKNGQLRLKNEILRKFERVANQKNGIIVAEVKSREELNSALIDKLRDYLKEKYLAKEVVINAAIDEKIRGGVIVRVEDEIFDASVSGQLQKMKAALAD